MRRKGYEGLYGLNEGYRQVQRSLQMLERHPALQAAEIDRLRALAAEACAATNSYLLEALAAAETTRAGRLFVRRKAREHQEDQ